MKEKEYMIQIKWRKYAGIRVDDYSYKVWPPIFVTFGH
jgi:hypothetical protein